MRNAADGTQAEEGNHSKLLGDEKEEERSEESVQLFDVAQGVPVPQLPRYQLRPGRAANGRQGILHLVDDEMDALQRHPRQQLEQNDEGAFIKVDNLIHDRSYKCEPIPFQWVGHKSKDHILPSWID